MAASTPHTLIRPSGTFSREREKGVVKQGFSPITPFSRLREKVGEARMRVSSKERVTRERRYFRPAP